MAYNIQILSSKEFDRLPYDGIHDSLGFADVKGGKVFVRDTGVHDLNKYLISHEIDHLVEEHATHEDSHGIRHKKGPKLFKDIFLPFISAGLTGGGAGGGSSIINGITSLFGGEQQPSSGSYAPQQQQQSSGSYSPFSGFNLNLGSGSSRVPEPTSGSYSPSLGSGLNAGITNNSGTGELPPELLQKLRGNYEGRLTF
jgi:hypothetical protein